MLIFHNGLTNCNSDGSFQLGAIMNPAVMNILEHIFAWAAVLIWFERTLRSGNAVFTKMIVQFTFPPAVYENFSCTTSLTTPGTFPFHLSPSGGHIISPATLNK